MQTFRPLAPLGTSKENAHYLHVHRRQKASTACTECRKQKSKCTVRDGESECDRCIQNLTECVVDATEDLRRKLGQKRKVQGLEENEKLLFRLVETLAEALGESSDAHIKGLVRLIRNKAPLEEIKVFMEYADSASNEKNMDTAISLMAHDAINYKASDCDAKDESTDRSLSDPPPNSQENGSYARLDIANLIHSMNP